MAFDVTLGHRSLAPQFASGRLVYSCRLHMQYSSPEKYQGKGAAAQKSSVFITLPKRWTPWPFFHLVLLYVGLCCAKRQV